MTAFAHKDRILEIHPGIAYAHPHHAQLIAANLRPHEIAELGALGVGSAVDYIVRSINRSEIAYAWEVDGTVGCMWGVVLPTLTDNRGYGWTMMTRKIEDHPFTFLRGSRAVIKAKLELVPEIEGHVEVGFEVSQKWLRWAGFEVEGDLRRTGSINYYKVRARR